MKLFFIEVQNKPSSNIYFENLFNDNIDRAAIYMLPRIVTHNTYIHSFQFKILNNVLFLNKKLNIFAIKSSTLCSFCSLYHETSFDICDRVKCLWSDLVKCFRNTLILSTLTQQTAIFGILDSLGITSFFENNRVFVNNILLIYKLYVYKTREEKFVNINNLTAVIRKVKRIEKEIALYNSKKTIVFTKNGA